MYTYHSQTTAVVNLYPFAFCVCRLLKGDDLSKSSNVFSYGMILWEIVAQELPFSNVPAVAVASEIISGKVFYPWQ